MADESFAAFAWHRAVFSDRCTLDPSEGLVMLALVRYADEHGWAFPGFATLCRVTRIGRTKLIESLAELEARGLFARQAQTRGKGLGSNRYQMPLEPPTEALNGERRLVRHANQSATRTSPPAELGSPPAELELVRHANRGSAPREPYLLTDLPIVTAQETGEALLAPRAPVDDLEHAQRELKLGVPKPTRKVSKRPQAIRWRRVPADWQPKADHRELAAAVGASFDLELARFRDHDFKDPKSDADAAFRNWLRNAPNFVGQRGAKTVRQSRAEYTPGDRSYIDKEKAAEATGG